jgi:hypothetical protein
LRDPCPIIIFIIVFGQSVGIGKGVDEYQTAVQTLQDTERSVIILPDLKFLATTEIAGGDK